MQWNQPLENIHYHAVWIFSTILVSLLTFSSWVMFPLGLNCFLEMPQNMVVVSFINTVSNYISPKCQACWITAFLFSRCWKKEYPIPGRWIYSCGFPPDLGDRGGWLEAPWGGDLSSHSHPRMQPTWSQAKSSCPNLSDSGPLFYPEQTHIILGPAGWDHGQT